MINAGAITASLETTFQDNVAMQGLGFTPASIQRGDYVNMNPHRAPWLGIYRTDVKYDPRALGKHSNSWEATITVKLLVQASHLQSGSACEDRLESYIMVVLDALWEDPTWNNLVDMITAFNVEYSYKETDESTIYFQWAMLTIEARASTG